MFKINPAVSLVVYKLPFVEAVILQDFNLAALKFPGRGIHD